MRRSFVLAFALAVLAMPAPSLADSGFRCANGRLVLVGDRMNEVRVRCGEPDAISQRIERRRIKQQVTRWVDNVAVTHVEEREVEVPVDEWTYDLGRNAFMRYVLFEAGRVVDVATGGYGRSELTAGPAGPRRCLGSGDGASAGSAGIRPPRAR
jgi:hypothetical protein